MDLFRFTSPHNQPLRGGKLILPSSSVTWVERYREAGEVKIVAGIDSGLREQLPVGTLVSHTDTKEVMKIEDHGIEDDGDNEPVITITGRSLEAPILENRAAGSNIEFPTAEVPVEYIIPAWKTSTQAVSIIMRHIGEDYLIDSHDVIPYLTAVDGTTGDLTEEKRKIAAGPVYDRLLEILAVDKLGIKVERPGPGETDTLFIIHKGVDRSSSVVMSVERGDVARASYLQSDKKLKNCAHIVGKWVQTRLVDTTVNGADRRWITVDAKDIDDAQESVPHGDARAWIVSAMLARAREQLGKYNRIELSSAEAAPDSVNAIFRKHYDVGDIVMVSGGYGSVTKMRVTEYAEVQDENGFSGQPTLKSLEGEDETP